MSARLGDRPFFVEDSPPTFPPAPALLNAVYRVTRLSGEVLMEVPLPDLTAAHVAWFEDAWKKRGYAPLERTETSVRYDANALLTLIHHTVSWAPPSPPAS
jgi:hypothetical protein